MIKLVPLQDLYTIYRLPSDRDIPQEILDSDFYSVTRTEEVLSIISNCDLNFKQVESNKSWKGFRVEGILDLSLIGILHDIIAPLKDNDIGVFVVSTYNTDYIFVKEENFERSKTILNMQDEIELMA